MKQIVLLTQDQKAAQQTDQWLRDLPEQIALVQFSTLAEFEASSFMTETPPPTSDATPAADAPATAPVVAPASAPSDAPSDAKSDALVLIADGDLLGKDPAAWFEKTRRNLSERMKVPVAALAMSYESPAGTGSNGRTKDPARIFRSGSVDDLVLKPLDRSLFLQKVECLLAFDPAASPSFLFRQKTSLIVEMGKDTTIDRVGESGFAIRNPSPLVDGVFARAYSDLFGEGRERAVYGRSYQSERHPQFPGEYLVYFSFFGITHAQLQRVRKFIRAQAGFRVRGANAVLVAKPNPIKSRMPMTPLKAAGKSGKAAAAPEPPGPELPKLHVAAIDVDPFASQELAEALESNFTNVKVHRFPSYSSFLMTLRGPDPKAKAVPAPTPAPVAPVMDLAAPDAPIGGAEGVLEGRPRQMILVRAENLGAVQFDPPVEDEERAFGASGGDLRDRPDAWLEAFQGDERDGLKEFVSVVASGRAAGRASMARLANGSVAYFEVRGSVQKAEDGAGEALVRLDFKTIDQAAYERLAMGPASLAPDGGFVAVYIDGALVLQDVAAWSAGLREVLDTQSSIGAKGAPVFVLGDEGSSASPEKFRHAGVRDFIHRPLDRRILIEKTAVALPALTLKSESPQAEFHACTAPVKVMKDVEIEEFSEYGALIKHHMPLRDDAYMALLAPALSGDEPDPVWARCTLCEKEAEGDGFHCYFRFFGIGEAALKRIRSWIREDYVHKKEGAA